MNVFEAAQVLKKRLHKGSPNWFQCGSDIGDLVSNGRHAGSVTYTASQAIAIAEQLEREASPPVAGFSVPWKSGFSYAVSTEENRNNLPPLEWRKRVDKALECVEFTRQCHNDRFFRDEEKLHDHDYRITAWAECVSDALKKIVAQDERIAKLEAKLNEFEACETVDYVVGRVEAVEKRAASIERRIRLEF